MERRRALARLADVPGADAASGRPTRGYPACEEQTTATQQSKRPTKIAVLRFLAQVDADEERPHVFNSGGDLIHAAVDDGEKIVEFNAVVRYCGSQT